MIANLLYRSSTSLKPGDKAFKTIVSRARARNATLGIGGYLHWEDGIFHQWIEGPAPAIQTVEGIIMADPRHENIEIMSRNVATERQFDGWSMALGISDVHSLFYFIASRDLNTFDQAAYTRSVLSFMKQRLLATG